MLDALAASSDNLELGIRGLHNNFLERDELLRSRRLPLLPGAQARPPQRPVHVVHFDAARVHGLGPLDHLALGNVLSVREDESRTLGGECGANGDVGQ